jgi:hypothetical protein
MTSHPLDHNKRAEIQAAIRKLMSIDPLDLAEKITGDSYKTHTETGDLGFGIHLHKSQMLRELIAQIGDTQFSEKIEEYMLKVIDFGFDVHYQEAFTTDDSTTPELFILAYHPIYNVVLTADSYHGQRNAAKLYFNYLEQEPSHIGWSGHYLQDSNRDLLHFNAAFEVVNIPAVIGPEPKWETGRNYDTYKEQYQKWQVLYNQWKKDEHIYLGFCGDIDAREALFTNLFQLTTTGKFFPIWVDPGFLTSVSHYGDYRHKEITDFTAHLYEREILGQRRLAHFPVEIQEKIGLLKK